MDGTDLGDWPSILSEAKLNADEAKGGAQEQVYPSNNNSSASWGERNIQQKGEDVGGGSENTDCPSSTRSSPLSSSSSLNECVQSSGVWGSTSSQLEVGHGSQAFYNSKVSHVLPGSQENPAGGNSSLSSANFNPVVNPSSWPLLVPSGASTSTSDGLPPHPSSPSASSFSAPAALATTHSLSSSNQTGLQPKHTDTAEEEQQQIFESPGQDLGSDGEAQGAGPNQEREVPPGEGEGSDNLSCISSSSDSTASWRPMPPVSTDLAAGASQADGWGGGGTVAQGLEGNVWGFVGKGDQTGWGSETGGSNTTVVSQGAWDGSSSKAEWSGTVGGPSLSSLAIGARRGEDGSSGSTCSGGSVGVGDSILEDTASPKFAIMTKAWDNQKGMERETSAAGEWGGQGGQAEGEESPSPNGGGSIADSGGGGNDSGRTQEEEGLNTHCNSKQTSSAEVALLGMLNRSDLDPRVLSNTGWGQTQIRQNVAWDLDSTRGVKDRNEISTSSSSSFSSATVSIVTSPGYPTKSGSVSSDSSANTRTTSLNSGNESVRDAWDASQSSFVPHISGNRGTREDAEVKEGKSTGGWGDLPPEQPGKGWVGEEKEWGERNRGGNWGDYGKHSSGWGDVPDDKRSRTGGWQGNLEEGGSQRGGWGGDAGSKSQQDWGSASLHTAATQIPNSQVAPVKAPNQQQQGQQPQGGPMQGGWNSRSTFGSGGPTHKSQNQSLGWTSGPIPQVSGAGGDSLEPSGWEEPSPQSISRKMEIDDGTSAWGDPTCFNKNVNLWDKNNATPKQGQGLQAQPPMLQQPPRRQQGMHHSRDPNQSNTGVGKYCLATFV